jgi:hypothetical protein
MAFRTSTVSCGSLARKVILSALLSGTAAVFTHSSTYSIAAPSALHGFDRLSMPSAAPSGRSVSPIQIRIFSRRASTRRSASFVRCTASTAMRVLSMMSRCVWNPASFSKSLSGGESRSGSVR